MTVKLLVDYPIDGQYYKAGELCDTNDNTEAGLIASKLAVANLTGGVAHVEPVAQPEYKPVMAATNPLTGEITYSLAGRKSTLQESISGYYPGGMAADWSAGLGALIVSSANANEACALDTTVLCAGKPSVKCTFSDTAGATTFIGRYTPKNPISLKNFKSIEIPIRVSCNEAATNIATFANQFGIWLKAGSGKTARLRVDSSGTYPGGWVVLRWTRSEIATVVTFSGGASDWTFLDSETITAIDFVNGGTVAANTAPVWIGPMVVNARAKGIVSLRMDRAYGSQYSIIKPLIDKYGIKASLALVHASIGTGAFMTTGKISEMVENGHEAIHHTYNAAKINGYANATDWATAQAISEDIQAGFDNMRANGWLSGIGIVVEGYTGNYFASATAIARQRLIQAAFQAAGVLTMGTISSGTKTNNTLRKYPEFYPAFARSQITITSTTTPAQVTAAIDQAEANGDWLIITMHEAVDDLTTPVGNQMKASDFATWVSYLGARLELGGVVSMPIGKTVALINQ